MLDKKGILTNLQDQIGNSALHWAAISKSSDAALALLSSSKVEVNLPNNKSETALMWACNKNLPDVVHALFQRGEIDPSAQDAEGDSALMYSVKSSSVEAALAMLSYSKVDVNLRNDEQETALMYACQNNLPDVVRAMLDKKGIEVNLSLQDEDGDSALHWATLAKSSDAALALLSSSKVEVNLRNNNKETALMKACAQKLSRRRPCFTRKARNRSLSPGRRRRFRFALGHACKVQRCSSGVVIFFQGRGQFAQQQQGNRFDESLCTKTFPTSSVFYSKSKESKSLSRTQMVTVL